MGIIKVMKIEDVKLFEKEIENTLDSYIKEVGGYLTTVPLPIKFRDKDIIAYADDEGLLKDNQVLNLVINSKEIGIHHIVNNIIFMGINEDGDELSLTDLQVEFILTNVKQVIASTERGVITYLLCED